jgi:hypothetical protein
LIGAETDIKTIAAAHSKCRSWVKSGQTVGWLKSTFVRYGPKADKRERNWIVR